MKIRKTHQVLDLHYHEDEGQGCFDGTREECDNYITEQSKHSFASSFMLKVVPMTKEEIENHPDNK